MKRQTTRAMILWMSIALLPLIPWFFLGPVRTYPLTFDNVTHALGQITGLVGMTLFALTFVLATRLKFIEKQFGGLDKMYIAHSIFGSVSFMLILMHPIFLILKYVPDRIDLAATYLLPFHAPAVDFGIFALAGMIVLLALTLYVQIKYQYWKMSHSFLGLFFIAAVFHTVLVRGVATRDEIFPGYYLYVAIVSLIGISAFVYTLFFKRTKTVMYEVVSVNHYSNVHDIIMRPLKKQLRYKAGQFAFFRFHNKKIGREFHPFTIASPPHEYQLRIIVKSLGDYTSNLSQLTSGTRVSVDGPYGEFTFKSEPTQYVFIAGGIGITPFLSMIKENAHNHFEQGSMTLYYSVRSKEDLVAFTEIQEIQKQFKHELKLIPWCSDEKGRLSVQSMNEASNEYEIYMCGPPAFSDSLEEQLHKKGVSKERIHREYFGFK